MRVRATSRGYDNRAVREPGESFEISADQFSAKWMEKEGVAETPPSTPVVSDEFDAMSADEIRAFLDGKGVTVRANAGLKSLKATAREIAAQPVEEDHGDD